MGCNPLQGGATGVKKIHTLAGASLISESAWNSLLVRLKACEKNEERLTILEKEKAPFLFTSLQLMVLIDITLSVKTRLAFIEKLGPRLTDPKSKASQFIGLFRFSEEKERVEGILKSRTQVVMSNTSLYRPQGLSSSLGGADQHNISSSSHQSSQGLAMKGLAEARHKSIAAPTAPTAPTPVGNTRGDDASPPVVSVPRESRTPLVEAMAHMSIWRDVTSPETSPVPSPVPSPSPSPAPIRRTQQQQVLQEGWCAMKDPSTSQTYYYNELTGESQWDPPLAAESPSSRAQKQNLPDGWTIMKDATSANTYYYNRNTGESTWEFPQKEQRAESTPRRHGVEQSQSLPAIATSSTSGSPAAAAQPQIYAQSWGVDEVDTSLPAGWVASQDTTGRTFYFNSSSGASQWDRPAGAAGPPEPAAAPVPVQLEALQRLPAGWEEMKDPASGRAFYHHRTSGSTQWELPR